MISLHFQMMTEIVGVVVTFFVVTVEKFHFYILLMIQCLYSVRMSIYRFRSALGFFCLIILRCHTHVHLNHLALNKNLFQ